mgnify:CR=1 FL=1
MILYKLVKNNNKKFPGTYGKYYARPAVTATISIDQLAEHMSSHNTPFSAGAVRGILTDMVKCVKELVLSGYSVKIDDLAIFSIGIRPKKGADTKESFTVAKNIRASSSVPVPQASSPTAVSTSTLPSRMQPTSSSPLPPRSQAAPQAEAPLLHPAALTATHPVAQAATHQEAQAATLPAARIPAAKESNVLTL